MKKEESIKRGNILLAISLLLSTLSLVMFFLPFQNERIGLNLAVGNNLTPLALVPFILLIVSTILSVLIFAMSNFPWGKILLVACSIFILVSGILLLFIPSIAFGAIISAVIAIISAIILFIAALLK